MGSANPDPVGTATAAVGRYSRGVLTWDEFEQAVRSAAYACTTRNPLTHEFPYARIDTARLDQLRDLVLAARTSLDAEHPGSTDRALAVLDEPEEHSAWWHSLAGHVYLITEPDADPHDALEQVRRMLTHGYHDRSLSDPDTERLAHLLARRSPYLLMSLSPHVPNPALGHARATWRHLAHTLSLG